MTTLEAQARESYDRDVRDVAGELAAATDTATFVEALAELVEVATDCRVLIADLGNGTLWARAIAATFGIEVDLVEARPPHVL